MAAAKAMAASEGMAAAEAAGTVHVHRVSAPAEAAVRTTERHMRRCGSQAAMERADIMMSREVVNARMEGSDPVRGRMEREVIMVRAPAVVRMAADDKREPDGR